MAADLAEARRALQRELSALDALLTAPDGSAPSPEAAARLADTRAHLVVALARVDAIAAVAAAQPGVFPTRTRLKPNPAPPPHPPAPSRESQLPAIPAPRPADVGSMIAEVVAAIRAGLVPIQVELAPEPGLPDKLRPGTLGLAAPEPEPEQPQPPAAQEAPAGPDDLQLIAGLDAASAAALAAMGVTRFAEVAQFREADIVELDQHLGLGRRIAREQWIEQAAILATGRPTWYALTSASRQQPRTVAPPPPPLSPDPALRAHLVAAVAPAAVDQHPADPEWTAPSPAPIPLDDAPVIDAALSEVATATAAREAWSPEPSPDPPSEPVPFQPERQSPPVPTPRAAAHRPRYVEPPANLLAAVDREVEAVGTIASASRSPIEVIILAEPQFEPDTTAHERLDDAGKGVEDREFIASRHDFPPQEAEVLIVPRLGSSARATRETGESTMGKAGALGQPGSLKSRLRKTSDHEVAPDIDSRITYGHAVDEAAVEIVDVETRRPLPRRDLSAQAASVVPSTRTSVPRFLRALAGKPPPPE